MPSSRVNGARLLAATVVLAVTAVLAPQLAAAGGSPKDGGYVQSDQKRGVYGYIYTSDGKVISGGGFITFNATGGGKCKSDVIKPYTNKGVTGVNVAPNKPGKVRRGKFKISGSEPKGFETTISGKFKSKDKAKFKIKSKVDGCTGKASFKKARYSSGG